MMYRTILTETANGKNQVVHEGSLDRCLYEGWLLVRTGIPGNQIDVQSNDSSQWMSIWTNLKEHF